MPVEVNNPVIRSDQIPAGRVVISGGPNYLTSDTELTYDSSSNQLTSGQFVSSVSSPTPPLVVASTGLVSNLNADLLDGLDSTAFSLTSHTHSAAGGWTDDGTVVRLTTSTDDVVIGQSALLHADAKLQVVGDSGKVVAYFFGGETSTGITAEYANDGETAVAVRSAGTTQAPAFQGYKARNTIASPQDIQASDVIFRLQALPYRGGAYRSMAEVRFTAETLGATTVDGSIEFRTANSSVNTVERWRIAAAGHFLAATDDAYTIGLVGGNRPSVVYVTQAFTSIHADTGSQGIFNGQHSRGTLSSPAASQNGDTLAGLAGQGYGATAYSNTRAFIALRAAATWTDSSHPTAITFDVTPSGSTTRGEVARFTPDGDFLLGPSGVAFDAGVKLQVQGNASEKTAIFRAHATTPGNIAEFQISSGTSRATFDPTARLMIQQANATTVGVSMLADGDTFSRYLQDVSGLLSWGPGSATRDITLGRTGPGILKILGINSNPSSLQIAATASQGAVNTFEVYNSSSTLVARFDGSGNLRTTNGTELVNVTAGGQVASIVPNSNTGVFSSRVTGDTQDRIVLRSDGMYAGPGNLTQDVSILRTGSNMWTVTGGVTMSSQLTSTVSTGTAPLVVASTTLVSNFNADLLDGLDSTAFSLTSHNHDAAYVNVSGDTITGNLVIEGDLTVGDSSSDTLNVLASAFFSGGSQYDGVVNINPTATFTFAENSGPPFFVNSSVKVDNLNADLLDGLSSASFSLSTHDHDANYVELAGDTMTGALRVPFLGVNAASTTNNLVLVSGTHPTSGAVNGVNINFTLDADNASATHQYITISPATSANGGSGYTITETRAIAIAAVSFNADSTITTHHGIRIGLQGSARVGTSYGIYIAAQSGSTTASIGMAIEAAAQGALWFNSDANNQTAGIVFRTDRSVNLYSNTAGSLKTDDTFVADLLDTVQTNAYSISNDVTDRAFDANSGSVLELADVVATLIRDLAAGRLPSLA